MALALVLILMGFVSMLTDGFMAPFALTWPKAALLVAAIIIGAFATIRTDQKPSGTQVISLIIAVAMIIFSRFVPSATLMVMEQYWLFMYGVAALLCALVIRRAMMPKK